MGLQQYKTFILVITHALSLLIASPSIQQATSLSPNRPFNRILAFWPKPRRHIPLKRHRKTKTTELYLNVTNHLGSAQVYQVEIKFRNQTQSAPNSFNHTHSDLPSLATLTVVVAENSTEEIPLECHSNITQSAYSTS